MENNKEVNKDKKICLNCTYLIWMVGIGQGLKCGLNMKKIPSKEHTCKNFTLKK